MNYALTSSEAKEIDNFTIKNFTPSIELMEKAGNQIFSYIEKYFDHYRNFLIVVGKGNNGGDGYVVARLLQENGYNVEVYEQDLIKTNDGLINKNLYKGNYCKEITQKDNLVIIDAIFGIGLDKEIKETYYSLIEKLNNLNAYKISIDVPSGINSTTGELLSVAFKADVTLTLGEYKIGLFLNEGKDYAGKIVKLDIGLKLNNSSYIRILDKSDFKDVLFIRKENSNKGTYGKVSLLGGSRKTPGALELSTQAYITLKLNVGYSLMAFPNKSKELYDLTKPELIYCPLSSKINGSIKFKKKEILSFLDSKTIVIGMGIGISKDVYKLIRFLLKNYQGNLLIDADGLNSIAKYGVEKLQNHRCNLVLTPHLKEFSRLINKTVLEIKKDRINLTKSFATKYNLTLLLKDNSSLIVSNNECYLNINGNSGLAKAGSGDILAGILGGVIDNKNFTKSIAFGSYLLGRSADLAKESGVLEFEMVGSDVIKNINNAYKEIK